MLSDQDRRDLLKQVISTVLGDDALVEWLASDRWSAHARLQGASGLVGYLLSSPEWQEVRFKEPRCSSFILTAVDDKADTRRALERLATTLNAYLSGKFDVEHKRGWLGTRTTLVIRTPDGDWRIGKRTTRPPRLAD